MSPWTAVESRETYRSRIDQAVAYINANLAEEINLEQVAREAAFSPFHFHRIFSALVGETPKTFINRVRLEKAANVLLKNRALNVTEIALMCGFSSSATFARAFKQHFGIPASRYRESGGESINPAAGLISPVFPPQVTEQITDWVKGVQVRSLAPMQVAYVANLEGYSLEKICPAWERLTLWASAHGWMNAQTRMIGISFDDPNITPKNKCRYYACLSLPEGVSLPPRERIATMELPGGLYALCRAECYPQDFSLIYQALYGLWLPESGYQPADRPTYEAYLRTPEQHPQGKFELEVCLPLM
ncbi:MAG TPA: GyrI-like domain-containing protein [Anaerolineaceae bacterium]|nr:GyrI-like domain-containing protein [Anaerolineaceae bacterium]